VIAAEQIPSKLVSDLLKNVNLKIVHRLPAQEDRSLVGGTMNLKPAHERFLATLPAGEAVVFAEGRELACHVVVPNASFQLQLITGVPTKAEIVHHMSTRFPKQLPVMNKLRGRPKPLIHHNIPACQGCVSCICEYRSTILNILAADNLAPGFQQAMRTGWDALWKFGLTTVSKNAFQKTERQQAAYCLLMNIAVFGRFGEAVLDEMRFNLGRERDQTTAAPQHEETAYAQQTH